MQLNLQLKEKLDIIIDKYNITIVGSGYGECICPYKNIENFLDEINNLNIKIYAFSWWCFVSDDGSHEPCGYGGPKTKDGYYSEINISEFLEFDSILEMKKYLIHDYVNSSGYKPCYNPSFYMEANSSWESKTMNGKNFTNTDDNHNE